MWQANPWGGQEEEGTPFPEGHTIVRFNSWNLPLFSRSFSQLNFPNSVCHRWENHS